MGYVDENTPRELIEDCWNLTQNGQQVSLRNFTIFAIAIERIATNEMLTSIRSKDERYPAGYMFLEHLKFSCEVDINKIAQHFSLFQKHRQIIRK